MLPIDKFINYDKRSIAKESIPSQVKVYDRSLKFRNLLLTQASFPGKVPCQDVLRIKSSALDVAFTVRGLFARLSSLSKHDSFPRHVTQFLAELLESRGVRAAWNSFDLGRQQFSVRLHVDTDTWRLTVRINYMIIMLSLRSWRIREN